MPTPTVPSSASRTAPRSATKPTSSTTASGTSRTRPRTISPKNEVALLPSEPEEYGSDEALVAEIQGFIHRYIDVSPLFERIASYYVLFTRV